MIVIFRILQKKSQEESNLKKIIELFNQYQKNEWTEQSTVNYYEQHRSEFNYCIIECLCSIIEILIMEEISE